MTRLLSLTLLATLLLALPALAHDTWVQTNAAVVRTGDVVHIDLMLGNHGNHHRDFRLMGKIALPPATLQVIPPTGEPDDLKPALIDQGSDPKSGYWTARCQTRTPGLHLVAHTYDAVVSYAPKRTIKSGKAFFVVSDKLDDLPADLAGYDRVLGHPLELVPQSNPVTPMKPGTPIRVKLLFHGKPLANACVSFIPRGVALQEGLDPRYERMTDDQGLASFTPDSANYHLIVAHHVDASARGDGYESTAYSATITVIVPAISPD